MRRLLLLLVLLLPLKVCGDSPADAPLSLRDVTTGEAVQEFLLLPDGNDLPEVQRGYIRYISQNRAKDALFCEAYWLGGEKGSLLDLTLKERYGVKLPFHVGNMCSRAAYSMALSYLGVDITPGGMSALLGARNINPPYDQISRQVGVERVTVKQNTFNTMMNNYLTDPRYSPVYLNFRRPNGNDHVLLLVAAIPDTGRYLAVDCNPPSVHGELHRVYFISLNKMRTRIINSTFRESLADSEVLQVYQWKLPDASPAAESDAHVSPN